MLGGCYVFYFYFILPPPHAKIFTENVRKPIYIYKIKDLNDIKSTVVCVFSGLRKTRGLGSTEWRYLSESTV